MTVSKRDAIKSQRGKKKRKQRMNTLLWVGGFIILLVLLFISPTIYNLLTPPGDFVRITPVSNPLASGKSIGDPNAPVKIEVYADFQCPACKGFSETVEKEFFVSDYLTKGQVYYEYRQFPFLDRNSVTKESHKAALASMCAMDQGHFWDYHQILFSNQGTVENGGSFNDKRLQAFAESIGLDMTAFNRCFADNKFAADIDADYQKGVAAGVNSTPTILLNGTNISPNVVPTYDDLKAAIDKALAGG
jgi:protein-disulfide isomerase